MVYNKGSFSYDNLNKLMYFFTFSYFTGFISYNKGIEDVIEGVINPNKFYN